MRYLCLVYGDASGAERLRPASTATTVRVRGGETHVTDGPFAKTPAELAGFLVLECDDPQEALARAGDLRATAVEVRAEHVEGSL